MARLTYARLFALGLAVSAGSACASRRVPARFPGSSAAAPRAKAAPEAQVTRALEADPPLPGADTAGWSGLDTEHEPKAHDHGGHHHGH